MHLTINGEPHTHPDGLSVEGLLSAIGLDGRKVAVELNREIVPKSQYGSIILGDGDALEIVHFIGGG